MRVEYDSFAGARASAPNGTLFLKGPLSFRWILENIPDPASRVVMIANAFMDMQGCDTIPLGQKIWRHAGVTQKDTKRRIVEKLLKYSKCHTVVKRTGRPSLLCRNVTQGRVDKPIGP